MKKIILKIISLIMVLFIIFAFENVYAITNTEKNISAVEYSEEYKKWLELSDEEKENRLEPRKYNIITLRDNKTYLKKIDNVFRMQQLLKANITANYDLRNIIPENVMIRNQMNTNSCWAFASIGMLESHLGYKDKLASKPKVKYDFSEKHMNYATAREAFIDNKINEYGFSRELSNGGTFYFASQYMASGLGAVNESDLPFVNNEEDINISEIQNKKVQTTLYDTVEFPSISASEKEKIIPIIKEHIANYGGIYAGIHGAQMLSGSYNNETGAIYCTNNSATPMDHAGVIIGWDDNYSKDNFNKNQKPKENGAWIIKNSWGEKMIEKVSTVKEEFFKENQSYFESLGYNSPEKIPTDTILKELKETYGPSKVTTQGEDVCIEVGDKGYMYISYEDFNVYSYLFGIEKAVAKKDFDKVYQNDLLGGAIYIEIKEPGTLSLANVFTRDSSKIEILDKISVETSEGYSCKVLVNPNGNSKNKNDLQEVKLKDGDVETFEAGYHTIEFAEPIQLTGDSFVVVLQLVHNNAKKTIALESVLENTEWKNAVVNAGESFVATEGDFENNTWTDLALVEDKEIRGNLCIKAYVTEKEPVKPQVTLTKIYIEKQPTKTNYKEGEDFDKSGMKVMAEYSDGSKKEISNYTITNGNKLTTDVKSITVQYTEKGVTKTATQPITVTKEGTKPEEPEPEEPQKPVSSNFENAGTAITESKLYFNSKDLLDVTGEITIKVTGINKGNESNKYTCYYYISGTQGDTEIKNWKEAKITDEKNGTYSITLSIKSQEIENFTEISGKENLYLYIKEIAEVNQESTEQIVTLKVKNQSEPKCYVDGVYVGGIDDVLNQGNNNNQGNANSGKDNTVSTGRLPNAGGIAFKVIIAVMLVSFGGFAFYRYKNIDK